MTTASATPHVVIVGGGFGGLHATKALARLPVRITLVDRRNHHLFSPLLYQVATAALNPSDIAVPIRAILRRQQNVAVWLAEAVAVDADGRRLILSDGTLAYDYLVLAAGATHSYFGHDSWAPSAPGLKTLEDALEIRRRVLFAFEAAEREPDPKRRGPWLTFVIIGAGPTGVELAGALAEISRHALARDFRRIDPARARVLLLEAAPRVLPAFDERLSAKAERQLERLGVEIRVGGQVTEVGAGGVHIGGERLAARTVIWAAGVAASPLARTLGASLDRAGRVLVEPDLTVPGRPEVFVIGDLAAARGPEGVEVPGVARAAIQMGRHAAANIARSLKGEPLRPFRYSDWGMLATVGRGAAVAAFPRAQISGPIAWWAWLAIHLYFLIGFRNRLLVLLQWAWAYLTWRRGARLITGEVPELRREP